MTTGGDVTVVTFHDLSGLLSRVKTDGGEVRFDGWDARLFGSVSAPVMAELKEKRLPLTYMAVRLCDTPCIVCGGVGRESVGKKRWVCTAHKPTDEKGRKMLELSQRRADVLRDHKEGDSPDAYYALCEEIDRLEAQGVTK